MTNHQSLIGLNQFNNCQDNSGFSINFPRRYLTCVKSVNFCGLQDLACFLLLPRQLQLQIQQQSQEIPVGVDGSLLDQRLQSMFEREVTVDHEVRQHQGR